MESPPVTDPNLCIACGTWAIPHYATAENGGKVCERCVEHLATQVGLYGDGDYVTFEFEGPVTVPSSNVKRLR